MPTRSLPEHPNLDQLRKLAKRLQRSVGAGDPGTLALLARHGQNPVRPFPLHAAQLVLARHYGFASWPRLRRHVELIAARTWTLREPAGPLPAAAEFLRLACLNFTDDDPSRRERAAGLRTPGLSAESLAVAAACADVPAVRRLLAADPGDATRPVAPYGWSPLMYLAYARLDVDGAATYDGDATVAAARLLLDAGADPNDGRFFLGLPTPFTVLTGVFGSASAEQPAHPHAATLAATLIEAGADPNDGQTLYNRMFATDDGHLRVLFAHGLGRGDGGPWHRLLGDQLDSPQVMLSALVDWAVSHDQRDRVDLLAAAGVDLRAPITARGRHHDTGSPPIEVALRNGHVALAARLRALGAVAPAPGPLDAFVGAALAGDEAAVTGTPARVVAAARKARPGLVVWAAGLGRLRAIELLVAAGFDVDAYGRADVPVEDRWQTALHTAAGNGDLPMAARLLELGADPELRDERFGGRPLDWARHFGRDHLVALLAGGCGTRRCSGSRDAGAGGQPPVPGA